MSVLSAVGLSLRASEFWSREIFRILYKRYPLDVNTIYPPPISSIASFALLLRASTDQESKSRRYDICVELGEQYGTNLNENERV